MLRPATMTRDEEVELAATRYITNNYADYDLSLERFVADCEIKIPVRTVQRCLKARGTSWRALVVEIRMQQARRMLATSTTSVAEIANAVGYSQPHGFVQQYRRKYGQLPSETRREAHKVR